MRDIARDPATQGDDPAEARTDLNQNKDGNDDDNSQSIPHSQGFSQPSQSTQIAQMLESQPLVLNLLPPPAQSSIDFQPAHGSGQQAQQQTDDRNVAANQTNRHSILAFCNGKYIGQVHLKYSIDLQYLIDPPLSTVHIPTTLVIAGNQSTQLPTIRTPAAFAQDEENTHKRSRSTSDTLPPAKKKKTVAKDAKPIPPKPTSDYEKAVEVPVGMTKKEDDTCLTCIKNGRKCHGTTLVLVKGFKRCETCAKPGKNTSSRICYWSVPSKKIVTYEQAQKKLRKKMGGRILKKNNRSGRLRRQRATEGHVQRDSSPETSDESTSNASDTEDSHDDANPTTDGTVDSVVGSTVHTTIGTTIDPKVSIATHTDSDGDLLSAVDSAYDSLYRTIAVDLGIEEADRSLSTSLLVEHAIFDALNGTGEYRDWVLGIDDQVIQAMWTQVDASIRALSAILGLSST